MESLYRKYRPLTFDSVVGQQHIVSTLEHAVTERRLSHAYLFCGPRGTGKTTMARILAKALLCAHAEGDAGCIPDGTCPECEAIAAGTHPDVYELDAASRTGVDNVREEIIGSVNYAPVRGSYKVYIIDEVHMLSPAAFNALLKTLEEPPAHVVFILCTTDPQKILETILSRCQRFDFHRISNEDIEARLRYVCEQEGFGFDEEALQIVARHARGGMRDALSTLEQLSVFGDGAIRVADAQSLLGEASGTVLAEFARGIAARDVASLFALVRAQVEEGGDLLEVTRDLVAHMRDVYTVRVAGATSGLIDCSESELEALASEAQLFEGADRLARVLTVLDGAAIEMRSATDPRLVLEIALTRLSRPESDLTLEALAERIDALEARLANGAVAAPAFGAAATGAAPVFGAAAATGVAPAAAAATPAPTAETAAPAPQGCSQGNAAAQGRAQAAPSKAAVDTSLPWNTPHRQPAAPAPAPAPAATVPQPAAAPAVVVPQSAAAPAAPISQLTPAAASSLNAAPAGTSQHSIAQQPGPAAVSASVAGVPSDVSASAPVPVSAADAAQDPDPTAPSRFSVPAAQQVAAAPTPASAAASDPNSAQQSAASQLAASATPSAPATPAVSDEGELQRRWNEVCKRVKAQKASRGALLLHARAASDDGSTLAVELPAGSNFAIKMLERADSREAVTSVVGTIFGPRTIEYRMTGAAATTSSQPASSAVPASAQAPAPVQTAPAQPASAAASTQVTAPASTPAPSSPMSSANSFASAQPTAPAAPEPAQPTAQAAPAATTTAAQAVAPEQSAPSPAAPTQPAAQAVPTASAQATQAIEPEQVSPSAADPSQPVSSPAAPVSASRPEPEPISTPSAFVQSQPHKKPEDLPWSKPSAAVPAAPASETVVQPASTSAPVATGEPAPWEDDQVPYDDAMIGAFEEDEPPLSEPPLASAPTMASGFESPVSAQPPTPTAAPVQSSMSTPAAPQTATPASASVPAPKPTGPASSAAAQLQAMAAASPFAQADESNVIPQTEEAAKQMLTDVFGGGVVFKPAE